jgi:hypothetical protein
MPAYHYYQLVGAEANEAWKPIPAFKLDSVKNAMFVTVLAIDAPLPDSPTQDQINDAKYLGPLYFDLDDRESPTSTAKHAITLVAKLVELSVEIKDIAIYATGGKGFHILVPTGCFMVKPPKAGFNRLPAIYKEMAFSLAVTSLDFVVYSAKRGRMFRQANVQRPNGMYKVRITLDELEQIAELPQDAAEALYQAICSEPRPDEWNSSVGEIAPGLMALFDECRVKVGKKKPAAKRAITLPKELPSFDAMLRGEGIREGVGFHQLALQIAITSHAKGLGETELLEAAEGLIENHVSDGGRYNTKVKRRNELSRMWQYTHENPCYDYSPGAIVSLLSHQAPDLQGVAITEEEALELRAEGPAVEGAEYEHANVVLTKNGAFTLTENGPKQVTAVSFDNVSELVSPETAEVSVLRADVSVAGRKLGTKVFELDTFNSVSSLNRSIMRFGQSFSGNDVQARGLYMRMVEKARKTNRRIYTVGREGMDLLTIPFHDDERLHKPFPVWTDGNAVILPPWAQEAGLNLIFVGFPDERGAYKTDLSAGPTLASLDGEQKALLKSTMSDLLQCQKPSYLGKLVGWMVAAIYRMWFHKVYTQFPLLHINGSAGAGKTAMSRLCANFHYYNEEPKMVTPGSTTFAISSNASASSSVPLIIDEYKPQDMKPGVHDILKLLLRDAYNNRVTERGGGTRESSDYRSLHSTNISAPICFVAEAIESEPALMERVVLLTLVKPPVVQAQRYLKHFQRACANKQMLGVIGQYLVAEAINEWTLESFREKFDPVYDSARKELMLQEDDDVTQMSVEQYTAKASAKERTVFNYAVAKFGLLQLKRVLEALYGDDLNPLIQPMLDEAYSNVAELQQQTQPEWLKVLNTFTHMTVLPVDDSARLVKGTEYAIIDYDGQPCLELYARACYFKYRVYMKQAGLKPLYPSQSAFEHGLRTLPALVGHGVAHTLIAPGGSFILSIEELRQVGYIPPTA